MSKTQGGYDINGAVTPFTQQPVPLLDSSLWMTASVTELWEQMAVLNSRLVVVATMNKQEYITPIRQAIANLEAVIQFRTQSNENKIT